MLSLQLVGRLRDPVNLKVHTSYFPYPPSVCVEGKRRGCLCHRLRTPSTPYFSTIALCLPTLTLLLTWKLGTLCRRYLSLGMYKLLFASHLLLKFDQLRGRVGWPRHFSDQSAVTDGKYMNRECRCNDLDKQWIQETQNQSKRILFENCMW